MLSAPATTCTRSAALHFVRKSPLIVPILPAMRAVVVLLVSLIVSCGKTERTASRSSGSGSDSDGTRANRSELVDRPTTRVCEKARSLFGDGAECIETELPDLTSPAGKVTRVMKEGDQIGDWAYVVTRPDGSMIVGGGTDRAGFIEKLLEPIDAKAMAPELLAKLDSTLHTEVALVRCLPGTNDSLTAKDGKPIECKPPTSTHVGDKLVLSYIVEEFPHPRIHDRHHHRVLAKTVDVRDHRLVLTRSEPLVDLPADAPLPAGAPPLPMMTTPPTWVGKPIVADAAVNTALCGAARQQVVGMAERKCQAFAYPSLHTPIGSWFDLANDAGVHLIGLQKPNGTIVVDRGWLTVPSFGTAMGTIVATYDPTLLRSDKLIALYLFLQSSPVRVLCLAGSHDVIRDRKCKPPSAEKKDDAIILTFLGEELPVPDGVGNVHKRALRSFRVELRPGGPSGVRWREERSTVF